MPKTKEEVLVSKRERMADPGYYVSYMADRSGPMPQCGDFEDCSVICIGSNATAKYARYDNCDEWSTLMWNCAPTRKFMITKNPRPVPAKGGLGFEEKFIYYTTWQDFLTNCPYKVPKITKQLKAPNDDFSP